MLYFNSLHFMLLDMHFLQGKGRNRSSVALCSHSRIKAGTAIREEDVDAGGRVAFPKETAALPQQCSNQCVKEMQKEPNKKCLAMWMGGTMKHLSLYMFLMAPSILMEQKIHFINNILLSEISQTVTSCLNIHIQAIPFFP